MSVFLPSCLLNRDVPLLQVHREPRCGQAGAKGTRTQEDPSGHRRLPNLQGEDQEKTRWASQLCPLSSKGNTYRLNKSKVKRQSMKGILFFFS